MINKTNEQLEEARVRLLNAEQLVATAAEHLRKAEVTTFNNWKQYHLREAEACGNWARNLIGEALS